MAVLTCLSHRERLTTQRKILATYSLKLAAIASYDIDQ